MGYYLYEDLEYPYVAFFFSPFVGVTDFVAHSVGRRRGKDLHVTSPFAITTSINDHRIGRERDAVVLCKIRTGTVRLARIRTWEV